MKTVVLYHANCHDGLGSAYAAYLNLKDDAVYIPTSYSDSFNADDYKGKVVYILDFSLKRKEYLELLSTAEKVVVLDHHKTAHEEIGDLVTIDQTKSGARLAWEYFHKDLTEIPYIISRIEDRDLWLFKYDDTKAVNAWMTTNTLGLSPKEFADKLDYISYDDIVKEGNVLVKYIESQSEVIAKDFWLMSLLGHVVPVVNCPPGLSSLVGNMLAKNNTFSVTYSDAYPYRRVSLRSVGKFDVSAIAKKFNGGGHRNAAGFIVNLSEGYDILKHL